VSYSSDFLLYVLCNAVDWEFIIGVVRCRCIIWPNCCWHFAKHRWWWPLTDMSDTLLSTLVGGSGSLLSIDAGNSGGIESGNSCGYTTSCANENEATQAGVSLHGAAGECAERLHSLAILGLCAHCVRCSCWCSLIVIICAVHSHSHRSHKCYMVPYLHRRRPSVLTESSIAEMVCLKSYMKSWSRVVIVYGFLHMDAMWWLILLSFEPQWQ